MTLNGAMSDCTLDLDARGDAIWWRDRFLEALEAFSDADGRRRILASFLDLLKLRHPDLTSEPLVDPVAAARQTDASAAVLEAELARIRGEARELADRLSATQARLEAAQADLAGARETIAALRSQRERVTKKNREIQRLERELAEAKELRNAMSRQLRLAKDALDPLQEEVKAKHDRLTLLERQCGALRAAEAQWRAQWEQAHRLLTDPRVAARDLVLVLETLQHLREVLALSMDWPSSLHDVVAKGIAEIRQALAGIQRLSTRATGGTA